MATATDLRERLNLSRWALAHRPLVLFLLLAIVAAVAAFHPSLGGYKPASAPVKARVLVLNGADDPFNKPEAIDAFKKDMDAAKADYKFVNYPGAVHAFTNPEASEKGKKYNLPLAYNAKVDKESKAEAAKFFRAAFAKK